MVGVLLLVKHSDLHQSSLSVQTETVLFLLTHSLGLECVPDVDVEVVVTSQ